MITVEKALKSNKTKNATETGVNPKWSTKKKVFALIIGGVGALLLFKLFKGNKNDGSAKVYIPNS